MEAFLLAQLAENRAAMTAQTEALDLARAILAGPVGEDTVPARCAYALARALLDLQDLLDHERALHGSLSASYYDSQRRFLEEIDDLRRDRDTLSGSHPPQSPATREEGPP